jgi:hypothetical protein
MAAPNLTIKIEPAESGSAVYGALAAKTSSDFPNGQLSLVLTIMNNENSSVHLNQVKVSFVGPPNVNPSVIPADLIIPSKQVGQWYFQNTNNIILPVPAPGALKVELFCDNFTQPATAQSSLVQYVCPAAGGGYSFPGNAGDLNKGEFWTGTSAIHGAAGGGTQLFAYDLLIRVYDPATSQWPTSKPGSDNTKNENYYIWGKPIYAMADGVVREIRDGIAANTPPGLPSPTPNPVEGNHFYIQHGPDLALYAHFQAGTLNSALTSGPNPDGSGAQVTEGQFLGLAGNSGNSSEPHLHIQVNRTTAPWQGPPRPLPFNGIEVLELSQVDPNVWPPNTDTPWSNALGQDVPSVLSAIWPGSLRFGKKRFFIVFAWAWIIIIGALMITPGGIECIACGPILSRLLGVVSVALGVAGLVIYLSSSRSAKDRSIGAPPAMKGDLHGS